MDPHPHPQAQDNGTQKWTHPHTHAAEPFYRECLKNHAATLGAHATDGCGEFIASPASTPSDPSSLTCAACGCHRNFHRRHFNNNNTDDDDDDEHELEEEDTNEDHFAAGSYNDGDCEVSRRQHSTSPPPPSAPHMLLALSTGLSTAGPSAVPPARKRFRSKFSPEQKERMQELSERLGWRMQKRDEGLVEDRCREIGVGKGVFKVWMHNNKQRSSPGSGSDNNHNNNNTRDAATMAMNGS